MNTNKTALITGATSGFGEVILRHLIKEGYTVIVFGRSIEKLNTIKSNYTSNQSQIEVVQCDLSSFESVIEACDAVKKNYTQIDLLILNAGLWNFHFRESKDGVEEILHVNLLAPIMMFDLLTDLIPKNSKSKVIFTSSGLHQGEINFDDFELRKKFSGFSSYRQSKLGLILMTRWLASKKENEGISFYSVHPGVVNTKLGRDAGWFSRFVFYLIGKSVEKGARTHLHLIDELPNNLSNGEYYSNKKVTKTTTQSYDLKVAEKLYYKISEYIRKAYSKYGKNED